MANADENTSLLNESTYEILSESTYSLTDEEGEDGGSSVNSFDDGSIDDLSNLGDTDSLEEFNTAPREHAGIPTFGGLDEYQLDNTITLKEEPVSPSHIEFDEPASKSGNISVVHILQEFTPVDSTQIANQLKLANPPETLFNTIRQTMCQDLLCLDEPFRFLYIGNTCAKEEIFNKLGAALALPIVECASSTTSTDSKSSRFNVIPVSSFGMKSSGEVELIESFGVEMALDVCTQAVRSKISGKPDTLSICLNGNSWVRSVHQNGRFALEPATWKIPHLAVVFCAETDSLEDKLTRVYIRSFLGRYSIPTLVITQRSLALNPSTENWTLDTQTIHICLESRLPNGEHTIYKRLPIDLATFNNIDARQMNRNLACITGLVSNKGEMSSSVNQEGDNTNSQFTDKMSDSGLNIYRKDRKKPRDLLMVFAVSWLLFCGLVGGLFATAYMKYSDQASRNSAVSRIYKPQLTSLHIVTTSTLSTVTPSLVAEVTKVISKTITTTPSSASYDFSTETTNPLLKPNEDIPEGSQNFEVHVIGDNSIIVRPPTNFRGPKKQRKVTIEISRRGSKIEGEVSKLSDGVYTVVIPREEAWGLINVAVQAQNHYPALETFELDFGIPWLKLDMWKKFATNRQSHAARIAKDASRMAEEAAKIAEQMNSGRTRIMNEFAEKKTELKRQACELVSIAKVMKKDVSKKAHKLYQKHSVPVKALMSNQRLDYVSKAQRQAVRIWDRIVSGDDNEGHL